LSRPARSSCRALARVTRSQLDTLIDESALRKHAEKAFEFHLVKRPQIESRVRIPEGQVVSSMSPLDLLAQYFDSAKVEDAEELQKLAREIISDDLTEE
jgi:hypothetical protein